MLFDCAVSTFREFTLFMAWLSLFGLFDILAILLAVSKYFSFWQRQYDCTPLNMACVTLIPFLTLTRLTFFGRLGMHSLEKKLRCMKQARLQVDHEMDFAVESLSVHQSCCPSFSVRFRKK